MSNRAKFFLIGFTLLTAFGCRENSRNDFINKSFEVVGKDLYSSIYRAAFDSIESAVQEKNSIYEAEYTYSFSLDSLLCFNRSGTRFVSCIHLYGSKSENLSFFLGEKINSEWFFWKNNETVVIPRSMVKGHDENKPLTYDQLHKIALQEVYSNYLLPNGEINENWFKHYFEGDGYCENCDKAQLDSNKIAGCRLIWVKEEEFFKKGEIQVTTDQKKGINIIRFPLKPVEPSGYLYPISVTLLRYTDGVTYQYLDRKNHYDNYPDIVFPVGKSQMNTTMEIMDSIKYSNDKLKRDNCYKVVYILGMKKGYLTSDSVWARKEWTNIKL